MSPRGRRPRVLEPALRRADPGEIDSEVSDLLRQAEQRAITLLTAHRAELLKIVDLLLEKETIDGSEVYRIAGIPEPTAVGLGIGTTLAPDRPGGPPLPHGRAAAGAHSGPAEDLAHRSAPDGPAAAAGPLS